MQDASLTTLVHVGTRSNPKGDVCTYRERRSVKTWSVWATEKKLNGTAFFHCTPWVIRKSVSLFSIGSHNSLHFRLSRTSVYSFWKPFFPPCFPKFLFSLQRHSVFLCSADKIATNPRWFNIFSSQFKKKTVNNLLGKCQVAVWTDCHAQLLTRILHQPKDAAK